MNTKRFAASELQQDPLRRQTMQSFLVGWLGMQTLLISNKEPNSVDSLYDPPHSPPLLTRQVKHPDYSCQYTIRPPELATMTKDSQHHMQWTSQKGWQLDVVIQALPSTPSWNDLVQQRLLQVQRDEQCVVTCREEPWRLSANALELIYTTTHYPLRTGKRQEWKTRMYWNSNALLSVHCHGPNLPERSVQSVLDSITFR